MSEQRKQLLRLLRKEREELQSRVSELSEEIAQLDLAERREEHPCICVKLNQDIEIYDMQEQERRGRVPLSAGGFVAHTLTALKNCPTCKGTGKP